MYRLLCLALGVTIFASCAPEFDNSVRDEDCTTCETLTDSPDIIASAPWLSCWVESFEPESDLDPTAGIYCRLDSAIAFTGDERLEGINYASGKASLGDSVKQSTWRPGQDYEFLVTTMNPTFDMDFPVTMELSVNAYGGKQYTKTVTLNSFQDATANSPVQLFRPYDLWKLHLEAADGVRLLIAKLDWYELALPGLEYSQGNEDRETMTVSIDPLPENGAVYLPVEPGSQTVLSGLIKTAYKPNGEPREFNELALSIEGPAHYTIAPDGLHEVSATDEPAAETTAEDDFSADDFSSD